MDGFDNNNNNGTGFTQPDSGSVNSTDNSQTAAGFQQTTADNSQAAAGFQQTTAGNSQAATGFQQTNTGYSQPDNSYNAQNSYSSQNSWQVVDDFDREDFLKRQNKWFIFGIINTVIGVLCCCWVPLISLIPAIVSLVLAISAKSNLNKGDIDKAESDLKGSKIASIVFFVLIALSIIGYIIYVCFCGVTSFLPAFLEDYSYITGFLA